MRRSGSKAVTRPSKSPGAKNALKLGVNKCNWPFEECNMLEIIASIPEKNTASTQAKKK